MTKQFILSVSVAIGLLFSGIFSFPAEKHCVLPGFIVSPAVAHCEDDNSEGIVVIEADGCEFGFRLFEWLDEIF